VRVLLVHNRYRSDVPSGENLVVDNEAAALRAAGVEVISYLRSSDEIAAMHVARKAALPVRPIYSGEDARAVARLIQDHRPAVVHLHNPNPLISMAVVRTATRRGVPVVQTVHNHRHTCVKGTYLRDGRDCRDCLGKFLPWPAVAHGCYRGSRLQSVPAIAAQVAHRGTRDLISKFIALSPEIEQALREAGVPRERIVVKPNSLPDPGSPSPVGAGFVFIGRLSDEKGPLLLLEAWERHADGALGPLTMIGEGPLRTRVSEVAARRSDLTVTGLLDAPGVDAALRGAAVLIVPSTWTEAFPMVILEALARGRPVLASRLGGLPAIVTEDLGWTVPPDPLSFAEILSEIAQSPRQVISKGENARARYERDYHPEVVVRQLISIYGSVTGVGA
jgi:glycosyltransferase involved in cell wall biosynthesis